MTYHDIPYIQVIQLLKRYEKVIRCYDPLFFHPFVDVSASPGSLRWQHGDVSASLASLETCPFAISMRHARRVLVLTALWMRILRAVN